MSSHAQRPLTQNVAKVINDGLPKKWFAVTAGDFQDGYTIETFAA